MARPRLILLIRHGESEGNCDKTVNCYTPNHKIPLTETGRAQAFAAGVQLHEHLREGESVCFYTSPYLRTRETLQGILRGLESVEEKDSETSTTSTTTSEKAGASSRASRKRDIVIHEEPRMREQDFGNFQGTPAQMKKIWLERAQYGHFFYRIPHGESAADVYDRCSSFNDTLFRQFKKDSFPAVLVLVTHGIWARVFLQRWFRWSVEYFEDLQNIPHCTWICLVQQPPRRSAQATEGGDADGGDASAACVLEGEGAYTLATPLARWAVEDGDASARRAEDLLVYPYG